ncbi:MAG: tRNA 2-thiouridine(34) synthase MnmA [Candidatus Nitrotoga sp.]|nr:tRNA 2-thiouridine(34) synthase MnmA [Candidatus Nitrotoga sp.]MBP0117829.1 tRNA 2-thiouridine(34) synthase MnmA [Candidatus Nitrotoga sp.]MBP0122510.1 tRNA 2-thiouridine(34) synthase MnmA [Candidatus Nitrotoga sp.]MBP0126119.1 tRNA 2-thiouridine(34) synthase MnmA [Candidatus Nitrotoga sp.]
MAKECIVVGISGGVDSAVAALLLKQQGYDVIGLFMKNWEDDDNNEHCSSRQDLIDAISIADTIDIPIETVNFSKEYKDRVFSHFLREYKAGRTPNPDVLCNSEIKFKSFLEHAIDMGAGSIATGHYAQIRKLGDHYQLLTAIDSAKDQSYFLHRLNQMQLSRTRFPLGKLLKPQVREIARQFGLSNYAKKDSTGICFIGERPFREFLSRYLPTQPGSICTLNGQVIGEHIGLSFYTIGQRQGLGFGGAGPPWFVAGKDITANRLIVVQGHDHPALLTTHLSATDLHWISGSIPDVTRDHTAKIRYRQAGSGCRLNVVSDNCCDFEFTEVQWAATLGQSVVVYDDNICLGGGIIN